MNDFGNIIDKQEENKQLLLKWKIQKTLEYFENFQHFFNVIPKFESKLKLLYLFKISLLEKNKKIRKNTKINFQNTLKIVLESDLNENFKNFVLNTMNNYNDGKLNIYLRNCIDEDIFIISKDFINLPQEKITSILIFLKSINKQINGEVFKANNYFLINNRGIYQENNFIINEEDLETFSKNIKCFFSEKLITVYNLFKKYYPQYRYIFEKLTQIVIHNLEKKGNFNDSKILQILDTVQNDEEMCYLISKIIEHKIKLDIDCKSLTIYPNYLISPNLTSDRYKFLNDLIFDFEKKLMTFAPLFKDMDPEVVKDIKNLEKECSRVRKGRLFKIR